MKIKQHAKMKYLGFILDESLPGESMTLNVIDKINSRLKFLRRQNRFFLTPPLRRLLCNALTQPLFDYACTAWFPNLSKIRLCLQLDKMSRICVNEFLELKYIFFNFNVHDRCVQFIISDIFNLQ